MFIWFSTSSSFKTLKLLALPYIMGAEFNKACCTKGESNETRFGSNMDPPLRNIHSKKDKQKLARLKKELEDKKKKLQEMVIQCDRLTEQKKARDKQYETECQQKKEVNLYYAVVSRLHAKLSHFCVSYTVSLCFLLIMISGYPHFVPYNIFICS